MFADQENGLPELTEDEEMLTLRLQAPLTDASELESGLRSQHRHPAALQASRCRYVLTASIAIAAIVSVAAFLRPSPPQRGFLNGDTNALSQLDSKAGEPQPFIYDPANKKALFPRVTPELDAARNVDAELQPGTMFQATHVVQNPKSHMLFAAMVDSKGYVPLSIPTIGEMARRITEEEAKTMAAPADKHSVSLADEVKDVPKPTDDDTEVCVDSPQDWVDIDQSTCKDYQQYCRKDGTTNSKWDPEWGTFKDNVGALGTSADQACCACGGGSKSTIGGSTTATTTTTTDTTTVTTETTAAANTSTTTTTTTGEIATSTAATVASNATTANATTANATITTATTTTAAPTQAPSASATDCDGCLMSGGSACIECTGSPTMTKSTCAEYQGTWQRTNESCADEAR